MINNKSAIYRTTIYFVVAFLYVIIRYVVLKGQPFEQNIIVFINKAVALTAVFLLFQIAYDKLTQIKSGDKILGKKYHFKFYGTASTIFMFVHAFFSIIVFDDVHLPKFFTKGFLNETGDMTLLWGISALSIFMAIAIIGITAKEYNSKRRNVPFLISLGYLFIILHLFTLGGQSWLNVNRFFRYGIPISLISFMLVIAGAYFNIKISRQKKKSSNRRDSNR